MWKEGILDMGDIKTRVHRSYEARVVIDVGGYMMKPFTLSSDKADWFSSPNINSVYNLPTFEIQVSEKEVQNLVIPNFGKDDTANAITLLADGVLKQKFSIDGGIAFIDTDTGEFIAVHWDLGEVIEWEKIIANLLKDGQSLHTFSVTDAVVELKGDSEDINVQSLNWEEGLEVSREINTIHTFIDKNKFVNDINECLGWYKELCNSLTNMDTPEKYKELAMYLGFNM